MGQSKKCLDDHGIEATSFAYPFNDGSNDKKVIKIVSKQYDLARTANNPIAYLRCDGLKDRSIENDCRTYTNAHYLTYANQFTIRGWSHDFSRMVNSYDNSGLFRRFVQVVNSQNEYNEGESVNAIPIIIYHRIGEGTAVEYNTDLGLFEKEMKYLHDNDFTVLTMADLAYNDETNHIYVKQFKGRENSGNIASVDGNSAIQIQNISRN